MTTDAAGFGSSGPPPVFGGLLFPPGTEAPALVVAQPPFFVDLNLDQVVGAIIARRDEAALRPLFHAATRDEATVRYRQDVVWDIDGLGARATLAAACGRCGRPLAIPAPRATRARPYGFADPAKFAHVRQELGIDVSEQSLAAPAHDAPPV